MNILLIHKFMRCEVECSFIFFLFFSFFLSKSYCSRYITLLLEKLCMQFFFCISFGFFYFAQVIYIAFYIIFCFFCKVISMLLLSENYHLHNFFPSDLFVTKFCGTYWLYDFLIKVICIYLAYKVINMFSYF